MNFEALICFCILQLGLLGWASNETEDYKNNDESVMGSFAGSSSSCGDILQAQSGIISYKSFGEVEQLERCVWVIRFPNASSYSLSMFDLGTPTSVIVSGFSYRGISTHSVPIGHTNIELARTSVAVVTFYTGLSNATSGSRGFTLRYTARVNESEAGYQTSSSSEDVVVPADSGHIKYPAGRTLYGNRELSIFVLKPVRDGFQKFKKTELIYIQTELEQRATSCWDRLQVYRFDPNLTNTNKWQYLGVLCYDVESEMITNDDLIMLIFSSDSIGVSAGFNLFSKVSSCGK